MVGLWKKRMQTQAEFEEKKKTYKGIQMSEAEKGNRQIDCDDNDSWIRANAKPCPKCSKIISKNQGCMHMSCTCGH
jgi:hypothetical protein